MKTTDDDKLLVDRTCVITGATSGIGKATAVGLARHVGGGDRVPLDPRRRRAPDLATTKPGTCGVAAV